MIFSFAPGFFEEKPRRKLTKKQTSKKIINPLEAKL